MAAKKNRLWPGGGGVQIGKKRGKQGKGPTVSANVKEEDALPPKKFQLAGFKTSFEGCRLSFASLHSPVKRINQPQ